MKTFILIMSMVIVLFVLLQACPLEACEEQECEHVVFDQGTTIQVEFENIQKDIIEYEIRQMFFGNSEMGDYPCGITNQNPS